MKANTLLNHFEKRHDKTMEEIANYVVEHGTIDLSWIKAVFNTIRPLKLYQRNEFIMLDYNNLDGDGYPYEGDGYTHTDDLVMFSMDNYYDILLALYMLENETDKEN